MAQSPAKRFQDLIVWEKSHQMVLVVYKLTKTLPKEELFGLVSPGCSARIRGASLFLLPDY
jgi:hypothetical protein